MIQALSVDAQEWDSQIAERRLTLVSEDIEATNKQIQSLEKQKNVLYQKYKDIEFALDELRSNMETIQNEDEYEYEDDDININSNEAAVNNSKKNEGDFFSLLSELENEEASLRGELQSYNELKNSLKRDKRKFSSENSKLKSDLSRDKQKLESLIDDVNKADDELKDLQVQIDTQSGNLNDLIQKCSDLQTEEMEISEELAKIGNNMNKNLVEKEKEEKKRLEDTNNENKKLERSLANIQRKYQNFDNIQRKYPNEYSSTGENMVNFAEKDKKKKFEKANTEKLDRSLANIQRQYKIKAEEKDKKLLLQNSLSLWRNDRSLLIGKLKKAKSQLQIENTNVKNAQKRQNNFSIKFKRMLDENDPGDGSGKKAKELVLAGIQSLKLRQNQPQVDDEQLKIENEYNEELKAQLQLVDDSLAEFYKNRDETIKALNDELFECTQDGYLRLLQSELVELQSSSA